MSASRIDPIRGRHILVTGATGFLGKVVLCELLRQAEHCSVDTISLLVRKQGARSAHARVFDHAAGLPCFDGLRRALEAKVHVVEADLAEADLGLSAAARQRLVSGVTHIVHCAASVDFDRPLAEAASSNIDSSLHLLAFAKQFTKLQSMVVTSTAYVTPWREGAIAEALVPLPRPAEQIYQDICAGHDEATLLGELGHANTYTYTKCIGEHLLTERRGNVPLRIVRPSIISASVQRPFPGWIDSRAAFAGFVVTIGAGVLRVIDANPDVKLDLVPVDVVAEALLAAAFEPPTNQEDVPIVHSVAGPEHGAHIGRTSAAIVRFFRRRPIGRRAGLQYLGPKSWRFDAANGVHQRAPAALAAAAFKLRGDTRGMRKIARMASTIRTINDVFPYFTHHTFVFQTSRPLPASFCVASYVDRVCAGAYTHLMHRNGRQVPFAGRAAKHDRSDAAWAATRAEGSATTRAQALATRVAARRLFAAATLDEPSFLRAQSEAADTPRAVLLPVGGGSWARRLCELLVLSRPDLGFSVADVMTPARLRKMGLEPSGAPRKVRTRPGREGEAPCAALLQALCEQHGVRVVVPIAVSVHPASADAQQRAPAARSVLRAAQRLLPVARARGEAPSARAHVQAAATVSLAPGDAFERRASDVRSALDAAFVACEDDLHAFLRLHPQVGLDVERLRRALVRRGGHVLPPVGTKPTGLVDVAREQRARARWQQLFAPDLLARFGDSLPIEATFVTQAATPAQPRARPDKRLSLLLDALAGPIASDFQGVIRAVGRLLVPGGRATTRALLSEAHVQNEHTGLTALVALCEAGVLCREHEHGLGKSTVVFRRICDDAMLNEASLLCRLEPRAERHRAGVTARSHFAPIGSATLH